MGLLKKRLQRLVGGGRCCSGIVGQYVGSEGGELHEVLALQIDFVGGVLQNLHVFAQTQSHCRLNRR